MGERTVAILFVACVSPLGCRSLLGIHGASPAERAKVTQLVGPVEERAVPLRIALQVIIDKAKTPVTVDVCSALLDTPVTIVTELHQELGSLVLGAGMQVGAPVRLFIGQHGEWGHPTLFCPGRKGGDISTLRPTPRQGEP